MVDTKQIRVGKEEYQKLKEHKVHPNQSFSEVIKNLINKKEEKKK